ncbi:hypothetical protein PLICRDRAFT_655663 [Plicaturopsis crispa FD-325 SS-3]|nr:hypothetical protein PLICRDRAFT_655663 [Plicaturopsis crispa FD-325 SS-3]
MNTCLTYRDAPFTASLIIGLSCAYVHRLGCERRGIPTVEDVYWKDCVLGPSIAISSQNPGPVVTPRNFTKSTQ